MEIKHARTYEQMVRCIESVRRIMGWGRNELGAAFVPILLIIRLPNTSLAAPPDLPEFPAGIEAIVIDAGPDDAKTMILAASQIGEIFKDRRNKFVQSAAAAAMVLGSRVVPAIGMAVPGALAWLVAKAISKGKRKRPELPGTAESSPFNPETAIPDPEALKIITSQIDSILVSFRELAPGAHEVKWIPFLGQRFKLWAVMGNEKI